MTNPAYLFAINFRLKQVSGGGDGRDGGRGRRGGDGHRPSAERPERRERAAGASGAIRLAAARPLQPLHALAPPLLRVGRARLPRLQQDAQAEQHEGVRGRPLLVPRGPQAQPVGARLLPRQHVHFRRARNHCARHPGRHSQVPERQGVLRPIDAPCIHWKATNDHFRFSLFSLLLSLLKSDFFTFFTLRLFLEKWKSDFFTFFTFTIAFEK